MTKQCTKCPYTGDAFHKDKTRPDGLSNICKACGRAKSRKDYLDNQEARRAAKKARSARLREELKGLRAGSGDSKSDPVDRSWDLRGLEGEEFLAALTADAGPEPRTEPTATPAGDVPTRQAHEARKAVLDEILHTDYPSAPKPPKPQVPAKQTTPKVRESPGPEVKVLPKSAGRQRIVPLNSPPVGKVGLGADNSDTLEELRKIL